MLDRALAAFVYAIFIFSLIAGLKLKVETHTKVDSSGETHTTTEVSVARTVFTAPEKSAP